MEYTFTIVGDDFLKTFKTGAYWILARHPIKLKQLITAQLTFTLPRGKLPAFSDQQAFQYTDR
jgi:hypothetical protein